MVSLYRICCVSFISVITIYYANTYSQCISDTLIINKINNLPVVDGLASDEAWLGIEWNAIDQVWLPWGNSIDTADFKGRYKIVWSDTSQLLYFIVQITDDTLVDGYITGTYPEIYNYDIFEVFIDENASGGWHIFDSDSSNAENAFAYHLYSKFPDNKTSTTEFVAGDFSGNSWEKIERRNYIGHFPEFKVYRNNQTLTYEFSLMVYADNYNNNEPQKSRAKLYPSKVMGLSVAYCDNDNSSESPLLRDNFFGSVTVSSKAWNNHWQLANDFRKVKLSGSKSKLTK